MRLGKDGIARAEMLEVAGVGRARRGLDCIPQVRRGCQGRRSEQGTGLTLVGATVSAPVSPRRVGRPNQQSTASSMELKAACSSARMVITFGYGDSGYNLGYEGVVLQRQVWEVHNLFITSTA
jgi:hypothetical protein